MRAKKSLGQNFLIDNNICTKIVRGLRLEDEDRILEIGPGHGALTSVIHQQGFKKFVCVEKDKELAPFLVEKFPGVDIKNQDALEFDWDELQGTPPWKLVGNLPYNVASKLIWDIVSSKANWSRGVFMVQNEVAQRLCADPGTKKYGALTAWVKSYCRTEYYFKVPPTVFRPQPKVDSAVVKFFPIKNSEKPRHPKALNETLSMCFQKRRKQLRNILKNEYKFDFEAWCDNNGVKPTDRPETLAPTQFQSLAEAIKISRDS
ncbi:MAG: 16S rRNA (adenine(1518)-N(6)/adenine(1519)-N(6))-dimethyltransferase RsmA [Desulfovibrio sp.]